jgi:hypothetical protein
LKTGQLAVRMMIRMMVVVVVVMFHMIGYSLTKGTREEGTNNIPRKQSIPTPPYHIVIFPHPDPQSSNYMKMYKH